jgi:hypothetical protein
MPRVRARARDTKWWAFATGPPTRPHDRDDGDGGGCEGRICKLEVSRPSAHTRSPGALAWSLQRLGAGSGSPRPFAAPLVAPLPQAIPVFKPILPRRSIAVTPAD